MDKTNLLMTSAGKRVVLVQIARRTLMALGIEGKVLTTDMEPELSPACVASDGALAISSCSAGTFVEELLEICEKKAVGLIIPTIDPELPILAAHKSRFEERGTRVMVSSPEVIRLCGDKRLTGELLGQYGMRMPRLMNPMGGQFPMFAKPYDGSLSRNIHVIGSERDLTDEIRNDPKMMFQEYINPKEYKEFTVDMYYGLDHQVKGIVPRERVKVRSGEINKGYTRKNYLVDYLKERLSVVPGMLGCICLQLFYRESDHDIIATEINPRFGGGFPLAYHAGANFVDYAVREHLLGEHIGYDDSWEDGTLMLRYDQDIIVHPNR